MKKLVLGLFAAFTIAILYWAYYGAFCAFPGTDPAAILDRKFAGAAYVVTWVIQLGYVAWLGFKWQAQKRDAARPESKPR
jgi:hypothetical protein